MFLIPKIEKITRDAAISHFLLMFGYKLFSLYFPLFLVIRGFSLPQIGYAYLLIYLPIAIFSPIVGFLNHRINPATLASIGIFGYGLYALGMILIPSVSPIGMALFYFWQVLLGVSAALFFASSRVILMGAKLENPDRAFGWFYSANFYAAAISPIVGAFFIWKFNFIGVFVLSLVLQIFNAIFCFNRLGKQTTALKDNVRIKESFQNYKMIFERVRSKSTLPLLLISFSILFVGGFYQAFFLLFLKNVLNFSQNLILIYGSLFSFLFLPISLYIINLVSRQDSEKNIFRGGIIYGIFSIILGALSLILNFWLIILITIGREFGGLMADSGRSGLVSQKFIKNPEEAGALDTIFSPLGTAFGALIFGLIIGSLGYQSLFILGGLLVLTVVILGKRFAKLENLR